MHLQKQVQRCPHTASPYYLVAVIVIFLVKIEQSRQGNTLVISAEAEESRRGGRAALRRGSTNEEAKSLCIKGLSSEGRALYSRDFTKPGSRNGGGNLVMTVSATSVGILVP